MFESQRPPNSAKAREGWRQCPIGECADLPTRLRSCLINYTFNVTLGDVADAIASGDLSPETIRQYPGFGRKSWKALMAWYDDLPPSAPETTPTSSNSSLPPPAARIRHSRADKSPMVRDAIAQLRANRERMQQNRVRAEIRQRQADAAAAAHERALAAATQKEAARVARKARQIEARNRSIELFLDETRDCLCRERSRQETIIQGIQSRNLVNLSTIVSAGLIAVFMAGGWFVNQLPHKGNNTGSIFTLVFLASLFVIWIWGMDVLAPYLNKSKDIKRENASLQETEDRLSALDAENYGLIWVGRTHFARYGWKIEWY